MTPESTAGLIIPIWHNAAVDHDLNLVIPSAQKFLSSASWSERAFENLKKGLELRIQSVPEFFMLHDYSWVLFKNSYSFIPEPLHQITVLDALIGNWFDTPQDKRSSLAFKNVCSRTTNIWGLRGATPRSLPSFQGFTFVTMPFGWDDFIWLTICGIFSFLGYEKNKLISIFDVKTSDFQEFQKNGPIRSEKFWRSIAAKTIAGELELADVLVPGLVSTLIKEIDALADAYVHMEPPGKSTTTQTCSQLVVIFSIAHEVGHNLALIDKISSDGISSELIADKLAYNGLWNSPSAFVPFKYLNENEDMLCILSGYLFFVTYRVYLNSLIAVETALGKISSSSNQSRIDNWQLRFSQWNRFTSMLIRTRIEKENAETWEQFDQWLVSFHKVCTAYVECFSQYSDQLYPAIIEQAKAIHKQEKYSEPKINDLDAVDTRIRKAIEVGELVLPTTTRNP